MFRKRVLISRGVRLLAAGGLALAVFATAVPSSKEVASAQQNNASNQNTDQGDGRIEQGRYIVHDLAMCIYCHTPKDESGELVRSRLLQGGSIPVDRPYRNQRWALRAPSLAGLPGGWTEKTLTEFLMTGKTPAGHTVRPPMPPFRMKREDAQAVAAYLQSLSARR